MSLAYYDLLFSTFGVFYCKTRADKRNRNGFTGIDAYTENDGQGVVRKEVNGACLEV